MKMHYSRFGYRTVCGIEVASSRWLTRTPSNVTCMRCRHSIRKGA